MRGLLFVSLVLLGCAEGAPLFEGPATGGSGAAAGAGAAGGATGGSGGSENGGTGGLIEGPDPVAPGCSSDLRSVLDENGNFVAECSPEEGCFDGECIPACDAAAKSRGNVGCDFVVSTPVFDLGEAPPCFAIFVANNWPKAVSLTITRDGQQLPASSFGRIPGNGPDPAAWPALPASGLPVNEVAVLFMSSDPTSNNYGDPLACTVPQAVAGGTAVSYSGRGKAFHIQTDVPVSAYDIVPFGGARSFLPSAQLLLPTTAWGTNYVAAVPPIENPVMDGPQWGQVIAAEDDTHVTIVPSVDLPGSIQGTDVIDAPKGVATTYTLNAGEYVQWQARGFSYFVPSSSNSLEMSGSVIESDRPVAFVGGTGLLCLKSTTSPEGGGCDSAHQQIAPVSALGHEYVAAPFATRRADLADESVGYRIVGAVDGTTLQLDPAVPGAPSTLGAGQMVEFWAHGAFRMTSQDKEHPFYVGQVMSGSRVTGGSRPGVGPDNPFPEAIDSLGDEEFVSVLPPKQFLSRYVFFTDPTYGTTNLVLTRVRTATGFADVEIDCLGAVADWQPVGTDGRFEMANVDLGRGTPVGSCTPGRHVAESNGPFGLVVWGLDAYASYAYPAGGNVGRINDVVVPPLPK